MEKMFEQACRLKLRFNYRGIISTEDLWDFNVKSLDEIYKDLNSKNKTRKEESLLDIKELDDEILDLQINIIKHIVKTKLEEKDAFEKSRSNAERSQKILKIIAEKKDKELYDMPIEELEKMV
jgi:hypothetical protein